MTKQEYIKLINEDLEWLLQQPQTLERNHIEIVLKESINKYYPINEEETIDKACEWLEKELKKLSMKEIKEDFLSNEFKVILETDIPKWIDDFRKFMDGKQ